MYTFLSHSYRSGILYRSTHLYSYRILYWVKVASKQPSVYPLSSPHFLFGVTEPIPAVIGPEEERHSEQFPSPSQDCHIETDCNSHLWVI